ncbi:hypothetical protein OHB26_06855 [Nocardia sp. NBC_01503]|uniref:hypothetical protein n=1 Tax=Nocardia sp. NBC_01503 TaxID=2975997 RepID=UPI002E7BE839|nr:hypothetical protein [Nocardia sp. NBC_01503]WTL33929.1 hypothetical protein OHB26_06855 [Nocardia sp. NBC_01503]
MAELGSEWIHRRAALLEEGTRLSELYRAVGYTEEGKAAIYRVIELRKQYAELMPGMPVSRCPFTREAVSWPMDTVDLDGWFWEWDKPSRRRVSKVPPTWLAMGGAMRLSEPVTPAPFDCMPGPGVPYVVPRLLDLADTRAVIAEVPVGRHTGWAITYFTTRRPDGLALEDLWGGKTYDLYDSQGNWRAWSEFPQSHIDYSFDLRPWLESGKLSWIAPGDDSAVLREGVADCPYIDLEGDRQMQLIYDGNITRW